VRTVCHAPPFVLAELKLQFCTFASSPSGHVSQPFLSAQFQLARFMTINLVSNCADLDDPAAGAAAAAAAGAVDEDGRQVKRSNNGSFKVTVPNALGLARAPNRQLEQEPPAAAAAAAAAGAAAASVPQRGQHDHSVLQLAAAMNLGAQMAAARSTVPAPPVNFSPAAAAGFHYGQLGPYGAAAPMPMVPPNSMGMHPASPLGYSARPVQPPPNPVVMAMLQALAAQPAFGLGAHMLQ